MRINRAFALLAIALGTALAACDDQQSATARAAGAPVAAVTVAPVTAAPVANSMDFIGQTEAHQKVDLRARVTGVLIKQAFKEGAVVEKDALLYEIDPSEFAAARDSAAAKVAGAKATIIEAERQLERYKVLVERGTSSEASLDEATAKEGLAKAELAAAQADLKRAELDVGYTKISAPLSGKIGRSSVDAGNLIGPDSDVLATVVAMDPIRVVFSVSEQQYLEYRRSVQENRTIDFIPRIRLANSELYAHKGIWDFLDNQVDPDTGTIKLRLQFPNPDGLILPGQFVSVILESAEAKDQIVVPQASVQTNQSGPFVLVVDGDNKVELRTIKTAARTGTQIVVSDGLSEGEMIIVDGIQKVRPGATVNPVQQGPAKAQQ